MERNNLYPIFLKASQLHILIVGGGNVALEKLGFLLKSSPDAKVRMVAKEFRPEVRERAVEHQVRFEEAPYHKDQLMGHQMVIACTDDEAVNRAVYEDCRAAHILVNVADNPPLCDFYMGGVVTKGNVKVAISTNGKSPTMAKRLRQFFEEVLPENIDDLVQNLNAYRKTLKTDFSGKVDAMNKLTEGLMEKGDNPK